MPEHTVYIYDVSDGIVLFEMSVRGLGAIQCAAQIGLDHLLQRIVVVIAQNLHAPSEENMNFINLKR